MTGGSVREARPSDAPAIARLLAELGHPAPEDEVRERVATIARERPGHAVLVAEDASGVIALASGFVAPFLHAIEEALAARGATSFELTSNVRRADAHRFYEKRGYTRQGFRFEKKNERDP